jgi:hypothetical protein
MLELYVGIAVLTLPILFVGYLLLRRQLPIFWFLVALVICGTGYLVVTGAAVDVGRAVLAKVGAGTSAVPAR